MGKKRGLKEKSVSNGERLNVAVKNRVGWGDRDVHGRLLRSPIERKLNQLKAWKQGKNVMLTVDNKEVGYRNDRGHMSKLKVKARDVWGPYKG